MIKNLRLMLVLLTSVSALNCTAFAASGVYDDAGIFYSTEATELENEVQSLTELTGWDAAVVTTFDAEGKAAVDYADDYYDQMGYGDNGILYLIDMDNRELYISTTGEASSYINDERINIMLNASVSYASQGSYYQAVSTQITMTGDYYTAGIPADHNNIASKASAIIAGIIIGAIAAAMAVVYVVRSYKFKESGYTYDYGSKSVVELTVNSDRLINSFVTTRIRPRQKPPTGGSSGGRSGGSSMHRASSGRMHGGGGRKF